MQARLQLKVQTCQQKSATIPSSVNMLAPSAQRRCKLVITHAQGGNDGGDRSIFSLLQAQVGRLAREADETADQLAKVMTPREAYDWMDWVLMIGSTFVFIWAAAAMYCVYAHIYYSLGLPTIADVLSR